MSESDVMRSLEQLGPMSEEAIRRATGLGYSVVSSALRALRARGDVHRDGLHWSAGGGEMQIDATCAVCARDFKAKSHQQRYCGGECRHRAKKRAEREGVSMSEIGAALPSITREEKAETLPHAPKEARSCSARAAFVALFSSGIDAVDVGDAFDLAVAMIRIENRRSR